MELEYNQNRLPKKGDTVTYWDSNFKNWLHVNIISKSKSTSKYASYCNICYLDLDRDDNGIYYLPGQCWLIQEQDCSENPAAIIDKSRDVESVNISSAIIF